MPNPLLPGGSGDVLDIVVHKNIRLSNVIVSDILDSDHPPIIFHILDYVRTKNVSAPLEKFTDWERFQSLASNLISPTLFKSERLNANIKLTIHKALIRSVMAYACPAWEFAAESHLLKLQRLQNKVLRTIGNFPRRTSVRDMHVPLVTLNNLLNVFVQLANEMGLIKHFKLFDMAFSKIM
jgi:hypothetical protein